MADPNERNGENERKPGSADDANLSARLKSLDARISQASAQRAESEPRARPTSDSSALGQAFRLSAEFVAGVAAGWILGWIVDYLRALQRLTDDGTAGSDINKMFYRENFTALIVPAGDAAEEIYCHILTPETSNDLGITSPQFGVEDEEGGAA